MCVYYLNHEWYYFNKCTYKEQQIIQKVYNIIKVYNFLNTMILVDRKELQKKKEQHV